MFDRVAEAVAAYHRTEPEIQAWVEVRPQPALSEGPLSGVPFGVKDIIETVETATEYGSPLYEGRKGRFEAPAVTELRRLGAVFFGKTRTTPFAFLDPGPTRNPRNTAHTPGGSSSGSAAAVAAGVVPLALGTQTMGSIIRPSSFCGIAGFKPTFGTLSVEGVLPFAPSLDTVGLLAEDAAMCTQVWNALGYRAHTLTAPKFAVPSGLPGVSDEMQSAFDQAVAKIAGIGDVRAIQLPESYDRLLAAARMVNSYEGARTQCERWKQFGDRIGVKLAEFVSQGLQISEFEYQEKLIYLKESASAMNTVFHEFPFLLTPAAPGAAPSGLESTGDSVMNAVWTALGVPAITLPMTNSGGLPLGIQVLAARNADTALLRIALIIEETVLSEQ